ncbi:MAG TPA: DinB family protein [Blastocatellia bacterium]|nr:DinB family protein [Blastocatellia bacterium]
MLPQSSLLRLERQIDVVPLLLRGAGPQAMMARTASGEWSPHEHLAHLARHHAIFLERLHRIMGEDAPELARYRAEEDSSWGEWSSLTTDEVTGRLNSLRGEIVRFIKGLSEAETNRVGIHPLFGRMDLTHWIEFFLLHEAHHLYKLMIRLGTACTS